MSKLPSVYEHRVIAHIHTDFDEKFGIPRQSGLVNGLHSRVIFEPEYRNADALRGIEGFSHLWLLWQFSAVEKTGWSATVRPPRLGGNTRMGVFATRSPFRPNPIGLSCVQFVAVEHDSLLGPVLVVAGADLLNGTPIFDIKPYLPHADCQPDATGGFATPLVEHQLQVECPQSLLNRLPEAKQKGLLEVLAQDPRPAYQNDPARVYVFSFAGFEIHFTVDGKLLCVTDIHPAN